MTKLLTYLLTALAFTTSLIASEPPSYRAVVGDFATASAKGDLKQAFAYLVTTNPRLAATSAKEIDEVRELLESQKESYGKLQKISMVGEAALDDFLVQVTCAAIYDSGVLRVEIQFFRGESGWIFLNLNCDSGFESDLRGRARILLERKVEEVAVSEIQNEK